MHNTPDKTTLLALKDWQFGYDAVNLLSPINLSINTGTCVAFLGQNGVGKSSLLKSIMQLTPISKGRCHFNTQDISHQKTSEIASQGIAFLSQENNLFSTLSVSEHFDLINKNMTQGLSDFPHLIDFKHTKTSQLSGGQKQQLAIAIALARLSDFEYPLLLLDEPSANLQPSIIEAILDILNIMKEKKSLTIILAEQNRLVVNDIADQSYVIQSGQVMPYSIPKNH